MNDLSEIKRLEIAVANIALTIAEIIDARTRAASEIMEQKIAMKLVERWLTKKEAAELFRVTVRSVDCWMARGILPYYKIGRTIRFRLSDVEEHWRERCLVKQRRLK